MSRCRNCNHAEIHHRSGKCQKPRPDNDGPCNCEHFEPELFSPKPLPDNLKALRDRMRTAPKGPIPQAMIDSLIGFAMQAGINYAINWIIGAPGRQIICTHAEDGTIEIEMIQPDGTPFEPPDFNEEDPSSDPTTG